MATIAAIEQAMCARLQAGLGEAVSDVVSWDVMTDDIGVIIGCLPGAFVTFTGIQSSTPHDTRRTRFKVAGRFAVFVADYSLRGNEALRHGDVNIDEVGCYRLVRAVRRLLTGQDLGLDIGNLQPGTVRMVTNKHLGDKAVAMYECLFDTTWYETALENGHWPVAPDDESDPDSDFVHWQGRLDAPAPAHRSTHADWRMRGHSVAEDTVTTEKKDD
jgi:phage gp37-like protein